MLLSSLFLVEPESSALPGPLPHQVPTLLFTKIAQALSVPQFQFSLPVHRLFAQDVPLLVSLITLLAFLNPSLPLDIRSFSISQGTLTLHLFWFGKISHFMAPPAGDTVLFHQGYSFTNRRLFLSTLWDFWQLMAPSCVPLQALPSPKRYCPTPESIPHSWRQPTSSEGSAEGGGLSPWLLSLSLGRLQKVFLALVLFIT